MAKKKKPAKKPARKPAPRRKPAPGRKPAPAKKKPARKPSPQKKKPKPRTQPRPAATPAGAPAAMARSATPVAMLSGGMCTINQPDGSAPLPLGPIDVVVTVNHPSGQVCGVKADIVTTLPSDPLQPTAAAVELMRDGADPTKWNGVLGVPSAGNYTVLAWPCTITDQCSRAIQVTDGMPPPPPPSPP